MKRNVEIVYRYMLNGNTARYCSKISWAFKELQKIGMKVL